jgi:hypothetical protein
VDDDYSNSYSTDKEGVILNKFGKLVQPFTGLNSDGCLSKFIEFVKDNAFLVGGVGIGIIIIQLISVIAGCCLAKRMGKEEFV